jgi:hypothetical protein
MALEPIRNRGYTVHPGHEILRESSIDRITAQLDFFTILLVAFPTLLAVEARGSDPLDAHALSYPNGTVNGVLGDGDDFANTFVTPDERHHGLDRPVTQSGVEIRAAHTRANHLEQTLSRGELVGRFDRAVFDLDLGTWLANDGCLLSLGNLRHS